MAKFLGTVQGSRGEASRLGGKDSGIETVAASWDGAIETRLYVVDDVTWATIALRTWHGAGVGHVIYRGPLAHIQETKPCIPRPGEA